MKDMKDVVIQSLMINLFALGGKEMKAQQGLFLCPDLRSIHQ
jgi:hypothetical protein